MSDNKNKQDGRDRSKVDLNDPSEVEYLHSKFPKKTHQQIKDAIKSAGPSRDAIEKLLSK